MNNSTQAQIEYDIKFWTERLAAADKEMSKAYAELKIQMLTRQLALLKGE